ncbi:MAG: DUF3440 domain-containing protein [Fibrobacter sp.]|jgi:predicted phosphoadenosine phosphosulfate sulfurtransferase|nr:DUF3440 domain-containing protein [Fibrobacter sp.]
MKRYLKKNVYEAAQERVQYLFKEYDNVLVAFSGGKDSSVCLNLCYDYAKENGMTGKLGMYHIDYEAQYQMTTDFVEKCFNEFEGIKKFWLCLPIEAQCCCKMDAGTWTVWEQSQKEIWVREIPKYDFVIHEKNCPFRLEKGTSDYEMQDLFFEWFERKYGKTVVVIGIRTDESFNRFRAISSKRVSKTNGKDWINNHKAYPIYDWATKDVWIYLYKFQKHYNRIYDLFYGAGVCIDQMRVASPFNHCASSSLSLYKVIDPVNWGKMVGRVNGVNFTAIYGNTTAMGWKSVKLPRKHTWKTYLDFLLSTLDEKTRKHYREKFDLSILFWKEKGGALGEQVIEELKKVTDKFKVGERNNYSDKNTVIFEEYPDDLDIQSFQSVPSYKRMCVCILKNDYYCKYMGFTQTKDAAEKKKKCLEKYRNL